MNILDILYIPMGYIIRFAYSLTNNYMLAILLFALVMEILLLPFAIKQQKNQVKQASLAPKTNAIRKKYAGRNDQATQQKMQEELMAMYQEEKFNPAGGCLPLLIQLPIIMCLYNVIVNPLRYLCNLPKEQVTNLIQALQEPLGLTVRNQQIEIINYLREVGVSDYLEYAPALENAVLPKFTVGPLDLSQVPSISWNWLLVIPILTFVVMVASQKITQHYTYQAPEAKDAQNAMSMKIMTWTMPLLTVYIEFQMAAAIGVYWIFRQVLYTVERIVLSKLIPIPQFTEEDYKEAERQANLSKKQQKKEKKQVRSLHHIDDEEYLAAHPDKAEAEAAWKAENGEGAGSSSSKEDEKKSSTIEKAPPKE